jgi:hypothetical protein
MQKSTQQDMHFRDLQYDAREFSTLKYLVGLTILISKEDTNTGSAI